MGPSDPQPPSDQGRHDPAEGVDEPVFGGLAEQSNLILLLNASRSRPLVRSHVPSDPEVLGATVAEEAGLRSAELHSITAAGAELLRQRPPRVRSLELRDLKRRRNSYRDEIAGLDRQLWEVERERSGSRWRLIRRRRLAGRSRAVRVRRVDMQEHVRALDAHIKRLRRAQEAARAWEREHGAELLRAEACALELHARQERRLDSLERDPPRYLLRALGQPAPGDEEAGRRGRESWRRGAREIESYREEAGISDPADALGPEPAGAYLRYRYRVVEVVLGQLGRRLAIDQQLPNPNELGSRLDLLE